MYAYYIGRSYLMLLKFSLLLNNTCMFMALATQLLYPVRARGVKSRMCPPYPQRVVKGEVV